MMGLSLGLDSLPDQTGKYPVDNFPQENSNSTFNDSKRRLDIISTTGFESHQRISDISEETSPIETGIRCDDASRLLELAQQLFNSLEFDANFALHQVKDLIPFEAAVLFREDEQSLVPMGHFHRTKPDGFTCPTLSIINTEAFESAWIARRVLLVNSIDEYPDHLGLLKANLESELPYALEKMPSQLWVPLVKNNQLVGLIGMGHSQKKAFKEHHSELALKIADLVVNALVNSERFSQVRASAAQEERRALARNLHDAVNQSLFSAGLIAEVLPHVWAKDQEEGKRSLEDLRRLTRGAQAEIRMMLVELRYSKLIDVEIADLLHLLSNAFTGRTNISVIEDIQKDNSLPSNIRTAFYHFCQEALNNIVKHSQATQVHIVYKRKDQSYILCVQDNGCGFDRRRKGMRRERIVFNHENREENTGFNPKHIPPGHYGLRMMDELASSVGAILRIETRPGQGTSISIRWKNSPNKEGLQK
ncbi:MAG: GAF domain-containing sensor histidine kinase [Anaerolineaceae bacterium]